MPVKIPHTQLKQETLTALIEDFVTRDGTDYGNYDLTMKEKAQNVLRMLENKKAYISFDEESETCTIVESV